MTKVSISVNKFNDLGEVVGSQIVEMTQAQVADVVGHAAQLIAIHRARRRSSNDMEDVIAELDEAMYATDVMDAHAEVKPREDDAAFTSFPEPDKEDAHRKFWEHIKAGGRVWRNDPVNNVQEWLDLIRLGGNANNIQRFGYANLSIPPEQA